MRRTAGEKIPALAQGQLTGDTTMPEDVQALAKIAGTVQRDYGIIFAEDEIDRVAAADPVKLTETAVALKRGRGM